MRLFGYIINITLLFLLSFSSIGCTPATIFEPKPYKETQFLMDTIIEITAYGPDSEAGVNAAFEEFKQIQKLSDHFDAESQVTKINQQAGIAPVSVSDELIEMINYANSISQKTDGAFDITIGPLTELWGIGHKDDYIPTQQEIDNVLPLIDYRKIKIDQANRTVYLPQAGMKLDLGGIGKDYALYKAAAALKSCGVKSALINAGGDISVIGSKPDGTPWRIGVQDPRDTENVIAKFPLSPWNTSQTSGDYQRFFIKDNIRYAHILNPRTGHQPTELASVTLVYNDDEVYSGGDIASSGFMILGLEKSLAALQTFPGVEAIFVTTDGQVIITPGLKAKIDQEK